ncbi:F-box/FBD/LRR-repeat protein At1g13570-like [Coffea eugenioides]|uniref:F-box/FBD/LRR-repeat protein At1g13570-like n=1 Tax=Coffea arabica TaxID=13443 RepID=A0ABM4WA10_COFAR|nr:F-box/FBD/LRR-repeat protein At1g13570-like [Coffea arabica]XP_027153744.1 F-box/FBD/LRR-repeat protein At1g13570-like [Coffea eugenioides]XP_027153745.1 F-box/FBD/LRR-repeat protein At1g13570-like [Coffea eugenioides]
MGSEKRTRIDMEGCSLDRISSLPDNVIDHILVYLPTRDAARTSILSSKWRYIWAGHPNIVLNKQFAEDVRGNRSAIEFQQYYVKTVSKILFQHIGPILKFDLQVPDLPLDEYSVIDQWLLFLSRQGPEELILNNSDRIPYCVPSCIFSCPKLIKVHISKCICKTVPTALEGFRTLRDLRLFQITFESPVQITLPKLAILCINRCWGVRWFNISCLRLKRLSFCDNDDLELSHYINCSELILARIWLLNGVVEHHRQNERISLTKLLSPWPSLEYLGLNGDYLKYMVAGSTIPEKLPTATLKCLTILVMFHFGYNFDEIVCTLCLLRSAVNLRKLAILAKKIVHTDIKVADYLEKPGLMNQSLEGLQTVMMINFQGSRNELLFVKLLLANSPSIERMFLEEDKNIDPVVRLGISKELMQFSRASTKAKIIFQPELFEIYRRFYTSV